MMCIEKKKREKKKAPLARGLGFLFLFATLTDRPQGRFSFLLFLNIVYVALLSTTQGYFCNVQIKRKMKQNGKKKKINADLPCFPVCCRGPAPRASLPIHLNNAKNNQGKPRRSLARTPPAIGVMP